MEATGTQQLVDETVKRWFTPDFRAQQPAVVDAVMEGLSVADDHSYAQLCRALAAHDVRADLPYIQTPVMMIAAASATPRPPSPTSNWWPRRPPAANCTSSPEAAHQVTVMRPVQVADLIRR